MREGKDRKINNRIEAVKIGMNRGTTALHTEMLMKYMTAVHDNE